MPKLTRRKSGSGIYCELKALKSVPIRQLSKVTGTGKYEVEKVYQTRNLSPSIKRGSKRIDFGGLKHGYR